MSIHPCRDMYSAREIALATGVPLERVLARLQTTSDYVTHDEAVRLGRALVASRHEPLSGFTAVHPRRTSALPWAFSSTLHAGLLGAVVLASGVGLSPRTATVVPVEENAEPMHLVFLATPGPGGGGGGGGLKQRVPAPKALRKGTHALSSPIPMRQPPRPIESAPAPREPKPTPLNAEVLPAVVAPIVSAPADNRDRVGVLQQARAEIESHGPGEGGGAGTGRGTGLGEGNGAGVGPGSGGGTGGGAYGPGSGIQAPRLLREVKAEYTDEARRAGVTGDVVLQIVVRRDGTVGDVKVVEGLRGGLNERAIQAVRQWRFAPATRHGTPIDVIVEVAVEFKLR